jgi:preprotein translocase subunit SecG
LFVIVHVIVCLILILVVLLQSGKAADLAGAFGGTGSQTEFGGRGQTSLLSKITTASAIVFMITSLGLYILSAKGTSSVVGGIKAPAPTSAPAAAAPAKGETKKADETKAPAAKDETQKPAPQKPATPEKKK